MRCSRLQQSVLVGLVAAMFMRANPQG